VKQLHVLVLKKMELKEQVKTLARAHLQVVLKGRNRSSRHDYTYKVLLDWILSRIAAARILIQDIETAISVLKTSY
jgi:hypothetical protein